MKIVVFDTGPIISLTTNNLLGLLTYLKEKYNGSFYITDPVRRELIERPLDTKKFKFEALQVLRCINSNVLEVFKSKELRKKTFHLLDVANKCFSVREEFLRIVHFAEMSGIAATILNDAEAFVVENGAGKSPVVEQVVPMFPRLSLLINLRSLRYQSANPLLSYLAVLIGSNEILVIVSVVSNISVHEQLTYLSNPPSLWSTLEPHPLYPHAPLSQSQAILTLGKQCESFPRSIR